MSDLYSVAHDMLAALMKADDFFCKDENLDLNGSDEAAIAVDAAIKKAEKFGVTFKADTTIC